MLCVSCANSWSVACELCVCVSWLQLTEAEDGSGSPATNFQRRARGMASRGGTASLASLTGPAAPYHPGSCRPDSRPFHRPPTSGFTLVSVPNDRIRASRQSASRPGTTTLVPPLTAAGPRSAGISRELSTSAGTASAHTSVSTASRRLRRTGVRSSLPIGSPATHGMESSLGATFPPGHGGEGGPARMGQSRMGQRKSANAKLAPLAQESRVVKSIEASPLGVLYKNYGQNTRPGDNGR